jgi:hypothetical protein
VGISAKEAATLVGLSKGAIINSIKSGRLSAEKDLNGEWKIEPVELFRVYPPVNSGYTPVGIGIEHHDTPTNTHNMQREIDLLREMLLAKDEVIKAKEDALEDLRRALLVIEARSATPTPPAPVVESVPQTEQSKGFWARLFDR